MQVDQLLEQARQKCTLAGERFTQKRRSVLEALLSSELPLSAYEVVERFNKVEGQSIQPMSAYRILDFFVELKLVHKLSSSNKYVACSHLACDHSHQDQYFLVCSSCGESKEIAIEPGLKAQIEASVTAAGFKLHRTQFELECLCKKCSKN